MSSKDEPFGFAFFILSGDLSGRSRILLFGCFGALDLQSVSLEVLL